MATKPTETLKWAELNPTDGVSGQPAIIIPGTAKQGSGFIRLERPPRQDINWFQNLAGLWSQWLNQQTDLNDTHRTGDGSDHADVATNTSKNALDQTHRLGDGSDHSDVALNNAHRTSNGNGHSNVVLNNAHRISDGKNHSDVVLNNTHRTSDGKNHSDVVANTAAIAALGDAPLEWKTDLNTIFGSGFLSGSGRQVTLTMDGTGTAPANKPLWTDLDPDDLVTVTIRTAYWAFASDAVLNIVANFAAANQIRFAGYAAASFLVSTGTAQKVTVRVHRKLS